MEKEDYQKIIRTGRFWRKINKMDQAKSKDWLSAVGEICRESERERERERERDGPAKSERHRWKGPNKHTNKQAEREIKEDLERHREKVTKNLYCGGKRIRDGLTERDRE